MYDSVHVEKTRFYFKTLMQEKMIRLKSSKVERGWENQHQSTVT